MSLAWDLGLKKVQIETDSTCVVEMILHHSITVNRHKYIISRIRALMNNQWEVRLHHIFRESNMVADRLADLAKNFHPGCHRLQQPPHETIQ